MKGTSGLMWLAVGLLAAYLLFGTPRPQTPSSTTAAPEGGTYNGTAPQDAVSSVAGAVSSVFGFLSSFTQPQTSPKST